MLKESTATTPVLFRGGTNFGDASRAKAMLGKYSVVSRQMLEFCEKFWREMDFIVPATEGEGT